MTDIDRQNQRLPHGFWTRCAHSGLRPAVWSQCSQHGRWYVAGAGQASDTKIYVHGCVENRRQKFSVPLRWQKIDLFSGLGEERRTPWATSHLLDHGCTWYLRGRHLHSLALPNTKRVGRGLILCRDRRPIVTWAVFISVLTIFNVKAQVPPRAAAWTKKKTKKTPSPVFPYRRYERIFSRFLFWIYWKKTLEHRVSIDIGQ